jgi:hypothetical protein
MNFTVALFENEKYLSFLYGLRSNREIAHEIATFYDVSFVIVSLTSVTTYRRYTDDGDRGETQTQAVEDIARQR